MVIETDANATPKADQQTAGKERIQRVRIGLSGLAFVFLLVLIGAHMLALLNFQFFASQ